MNLNFLSRRVLWKRIATPTLEVVKREERLLVDGELIEIRIFEEWGLALGEDACLFEDGDEPEAYHSDNEVGHCDPEASNNVDKIVYTIAKDVVLEMDDEEGFDQGEKLDDKTRQGQSESMGRAEGQDLEVELNLSKANTSYEDSSRERTNRVLNHVEMLSLPEDLSDKNRDKTCITTKKFGKRSRSCPPGVKRSVVSGPWSVEWLYKHNHGDAGVIFSIGGSFRHISLKKVARLPYKDRREVLKILKKHDRRRRGRSSATQLRGATRPGSSADTVSSASVNNDWKHWVVMHGTEKTAVDDIRDIGKAIGVVLNDEHSNMFSALARTTKGKQVSSHARKEVRRLVGDKKPLIVCIQETKLQVCDTILCSVLWGSSPHDFTFRPSVGASGGLLTMWDSLEVEVWSSISREHVLWCHGRFIQSGEELYLANEIRGTLDPLLQMLWNSLAGKIQTLNGERVCVCEDFNAVRSIEERRSSREGSRSSDHVPFNRFIEEAVLIDLPLSRQSGSLTKPFTVEEVKAAIWDCNSYKSPGSDGRVQYAPFDLWRAPGSFLLLQGLWRAPQASFLADIMRFITDFHRNGKLSRGLNSTFIALIPKVDRPQKLNDFRPISLVGSLYKILAKVLANRLRLVIGSVISESQSAFVKDRQILDGILIANEAVDEARKTKKELMLFKVDFEKAYDSVDWVTLMLPLSPFLFLLAAEGLNILMQAMVANQIFTGYSIGGDNLISVSHLQFADDTLLLGSKSWANVSAATAMRCRVGKIPLVTPRIPNKHACGTNQGIKPPTIFECRLTGHQAPNGFEHKLTGHQAPNVNTYVNSGFGGSIWGGAWETERGREEWVFLVEGDCEDSRWNRRSRGRVVWGVCDKEGGGWSGYLLLEGITLRERFGRLFDLTEYKSSTVADMCSLGWEARGGAWVWRRQLWVWEEEMLGSVSSGCIPAFDLSAADYLERS
ncbi:hypothetical protein TSUD_363890 [Trifolium subterraneum]|uniref:Reverse transcriptase domain-containing protein n=1 Tax=Trifolium subterraneum TaxID=3900 RepID=A0A2Z6NQJ1_TRISU|nr:hypothetical protein TSUD_363890 [Trifolium subterraneum]